MSHQISINYIQIVRLRPTHRGEDLDDFLPGPRSVRMGVICLALLATVLEYSLLEMEELEVVAVGDLVALLDLRVDTVRVRVGQCWAGLG